jgi:hypothetical protein
MSPPPAVIMNNTPNFNTEAGRTLNISATLGGFRLEKAGPGTLTLTSANNTYDAGNDRPGRHARCERCTGNTINAAHPPHPREPPGLSSGHPAGDNAFVSQPSSLNTPTRDADIRNNDVISTTRQPHRGVRALVASGYNVVGDWQGDGITSRSPRSSTANAGDRRQRALVAVRHAQGPAGVDVDLDTVLIKFTHRRRQSRRFGHARRLRGLGGNYDENQPATWATGDMNYDGIHPTTPRFRRAYDESPSPPEPSSIACLSGRRCRPAGVAVRNGGNRSSSFPFQSMPHGTVACVVWGCHSTVMALAGRHVVVGLNVAGQLDAGDERACLALANWPEPGSELRFHLAGLEMSGGHGSELHSWPLSVPSVVANSVIVTAPDISAAGVAQVNRTFAFCRTYADDADARRRRPWHDEGFGSRPRGACWPPPRRRRRSPASAPERRLRRWGPRNEPRP